MKHRYIAVIAALILSFSGCTKLDEKLNGQIGNGGVSSGNVASLLNACYTAMRAPYQGPWEWWALQEFTSDEAIVPTRASTGMITVHGVSFFCTFGRQIMPA